MRPLAWAALGLLACASPPPHAARAPTTFTDDSKPLGFVPVVRLSVDGIVAAHAGGGPLDPGSIPEIEVKGTVIDARDGAIVLSGQGEARRRSFQAEAGPPLAMPFAVGDAIVVHVWIVPVPPPNPSRRGVVITGARGDLLYADVPDPTMLGPDWSVQEGPLVQVSNQGRVHTKETGLVLQHRGRAAVVRPPEWRRLEAAGGAYAVFGRTTSIAFDAMPGGQVVPDERGGGDLVVTIVRLPGA